jgi:hypothetical protein
MKNSELSASLKGLRFFCRFVLTEKVSALKLATCHLQDRYHQSITKQFYKPNTLITQNEFCIFSKLFHST